MKDVFTEFCRHAGGQDNFAKSLWEDYKLGDSGSAERQRIIEMIQMIAKMQNELEDRNQL